MISVWFFCFMLYVVGYNHKNQGLETYLIDTPNCKIRNFTMKYTKIKMEYNNVCGTRHIFVKALPDNKITFHMANNYYNSCLYRFIVPKSKSERIDLDVRHNSWKPFSNGTTIDLKTDFIKVHCYPTNKGGYQIYDDVYAKIKKVNTSKLSEQHDKQHWNVLMIGMDSVSRTRALHDLPNTVNYFMKKGWLDFKGYNMIANSTFSNLMSVLANKNVSSLFRQCEQNMSSCNDDFIWSRFKEAGYVTAFGEDSFGSSHTDSPQNTRNMMRFGIAPTDHYLRTLFLDEVKTGPNFCTKTMLSVKHVFSYAYEFVNTYKKDKFFGFFQVNSLSRDPDQSPASFDAPLMMFFKQIEKLGILKNTFVIFFSDHGLQYSKGKNDLAAVYYEKRLPMLFMKIPLKFRWAYPKKYVRVYLQQSRLITPFDLHLTLWAIALNFERLYPLPHHEGCPKCDSLFDFIEPNRTCVDAGILDIWCTCHDLQPFLERQDYGIHYSLNLIMLRLYNKTKSIKTLPSTRCQEFKLSKILKLHKYVEMPKMFYVIAGTLWPDQTRFNAKVSKHVVPEYSLDTLHSKFEYEIELLEMTSYTRHLQCTINKTDNVWCVCEIIRI